MVAFISFLSDDVWEILFKLFKLIQADFILVN